jgi:hypothetical protein
VTLLPRHAPSALGGKVSPMCPEYRVTYVSGSTLKKTLKKILVSSAAHRVGNTWVTRRLTP